MPDKEDAVSYEMLQDLLRSERRSNKLVVLQARFWLQLRDFLAAVTQQFRDEQAKDPFGRRVMMLTDEVKNARHAAESLWALRERKLAMLALASGKDRKRPDGITPEEAQLFAHLVETLDTSRRSVFDGLMPMPSEAPVGRPGVAVAMPAGAAHGAPAPASPSAGATSVPAAAAAPVAVQMPIQPGLPLPAAPAPVPGMPAAPLAPTGPTVVPHDTHAHAKVELVTIRALGDIPPFVGPDMQTYLLKQGDIATVPPSIANLLVRRQKAAILDV